MSALPTLCPDDKLRVGETPSPSTPVHLTSKIPPSSLSALHCSAINKETLSLLAPPPQPTSTETQSRFRFSPPHQHCLPTGTPPSPFLSYTPTSYLPSTTSQRYVVRQSRRFPRAQPKRQSVPPTAALCLPFRARRVDVIGGIGATRRYSPVRYRRPLRQNFCRSLAVGVCGVSGAIHTSYSRRPSCATAAFPFPYHPFSSFSCSNHRRLA
ncbi:hypothetical protein IWZ01DRAFT_1489 [Phyllosticta capitalensis]